MINRFIAEAELDPVAATERLRAELIASQGPLVERIDDHTVRGTQVWHRSAVVASDVIACYQYLVDDPVNPNRLFPQVAVISGERVAPDEHWDSVLQLPDAESVDWFDRVPDHRGTLTEHVLDGRTITVYTPAGYDVDGPPYPVVLLLDGECWPLVARLDTALDNLMGTEVEPAVVAFVHNTGGMTDRLVEMACDPGFAATLADDVLPLVRKHYHVSEDPSRVVIAGNSLGGLAAAHAALERPDAFGAVLSCSGSHWWGYLPREVGWGKDSEPEWLTRQYAEAPLRPIRFWLDVGSLETGGSPLSPGVDQRAANRHLRTVLRAKGYDVTYHEAPGGHDFATFRRNVVKGLRALLPA